MPYSGQIKGWDLRNQAAHTNMRSRSSKERSHTAAPSGFHPSAAPRAEVCEKHCICVCVCACEGDCLQDAPAFVCGTACEMCPRGLAGWLPLSVGADCVLCDRGSEASSVTGAPLSLLDRDRDRERTCILLPSVKLYSPSLAEEAEVSFWKCQM